jgi:hypothetical protein
MEMDIHAQLIFVHQMVTVDIMHIVYRMNNDQVSVNVFAIRDILTMEQHFQRVLKMVERRKENRLIVSLFSI